MKLCTKKRSGLLALILFSVFFAGAQNPSYDQLASIIRAKQPGVDLSDKVIAFTAWSSSDITSRELNQEFDRVCTIYQAAKLRNGHKGDILVSYCMDDASTATIAFNRDNITYAIKVKRAEFPFLNTLTAGKNIVYDNTGVKVYEDLSRTMVFLSFNQLITR